MKWALHVRIFERQNNTWVPVLDHIFYGRTQDEAVRISEAHSKTDSFYRGCVTQNRWENVTCRAESWWEKLQ